MAQPSPFPSPSRPFGGRWRRIAPVMLRWGLPVLWVLWAGLAWWVEPRESTVDQLDRDLAAGRVVTFQRAYGWVDDDAYWGSRPRPQYDTQGGLLAWSVPTGQIRYAFVDPPAREPAATPSPSGAASTGTPGDYRPGSRDARLAEVAGPWQADGALAHRIADTAALLAAVLVLLWLARLVTGAPPMVGTRWFWFWVGLLPFGLGVLAWSYREVWRPPSAPVPGRGSGWRGFGWLVLGGIGLALLVAGARGLLGAAVVPG
ncbi:hypothetical protein [Micromonospora sp. CV4]|uniref:hypothetical protein n=1 Tax=Micromonospora sp. CV4 TaxID=2478711 RepID=UPI0011C4A757|nr:hypothetical protein [Micromonospora sp. CV4]